MKLQSMHECMIKIYEHHLLLMQKIILLFEGGGGLKVQMTHYFIIKLLNGNIIKNKKELTGTPMLCEFV